MLSDREIDLANSLASRREAQLFSLNRKLRTMAVDNIVKGVRDINRHFDIKDLLDVAVLEITAPVPSEVLKKEIRKQKEEYRFFIEKIILVVREKLKL